jgi:hypothetical protein|uniref:Uncharacterized protein n=1 Tax=Ignisphaera aggregans TaxID=334771 RepID=A0A7J3Z6D0_9CREN
MKTSIEGLLEYLIVKALAGKDNVIKALSDYFVYGESPSVIALKHGLSKHQVRGYAQRIVEKTGSVTRAKVILKYATPIILKIKPVTKKLNSSFVKCLLCGEELPLQIAEDHIRKKHMPIVEDYLQSTVELMRKSTVMDRS